MKASKIIVKCFCMPYCMLVYLISTNYSNTFYSNKKEFTNHEKLLPGQKYNVKLNNLAWVYSEYNKL